METGFQTAIVGGFRNPLAVFQIPKPSFQDSIAKICWIPESRFPYMGRENGVLWSSRCLTIDFRGTRGGGGGGGGAFIPFFIPSKMLLSRL